MEISEETKGDVQAEPSEPKFLVKLKKMRWTFKVKNNWTKYVTVEPLICIYIFQSFAVSSIDPYRFYKACVSLDQDTYFCNVITINPNSDYQLCAKYGDQNIYCKGLSKITETISCVDTIERYESANKTKAFEKPEYYRLCKVIGKAIEKTQPSLDSLIGLSVLILTFLVAMGISIWSDKYSKRKICLLLPILGQIIISIINLHGALSTYLSFDVIDTVDRFVEALSGGLPLFLFGCFTYMNDDNIRHKLLFRFGIICLFVTIYRHIPILFNTVYEYFHDDDSYISVISFCLVISIVALLYVKVILNESKPNNKVSTDNDETRSVSNSKGRATARHTKKKNLAKAFSLDVVWDYILLVCKKRERYGRIVVWGFQNIVLIGATSPFYNQRFTVITDLVAITSIDIDGAIFIIISIMILLSRISDAVISILVFGLSTAARLVIAILENTGAFSYLGIVLEFDPLGIDYYFPLKQIASCAVLLAYVDRNESRVFLIMLSSWYYPAAVFQIVSIFYIEIYKKSQELLISSPLVFIPPVLVLCLLGLLYAHNRNNEKFKIEQMQRKKQITKDITSNPRSAIEPTDKHQSTTPIFEKDVNSTHL